jgi:hypothetical protein
MDCKELDCTTINKIFKCKLFQEYDAHYKSYYNTKHSMFILRLWKDFINKGIICINDNYIITGQKKWLLAKIKYGCKK